MAQNKIRIADLVTSITPVDTQILFNDNGIIGVDSGFTYNKSTNYLTLTGGIFIGDSNTYINQNSSGEIQFTDIISGSKVLSELIYNTPGNDTEVLFNDAGSTGADAGLTYNKTTDTLNVNNIAPVSGDTVKVSPSADSSFILNEVVMDVEEGSSFTFPFLRGIATFSDGEASEQAYTLALDANTAFYQSDSEETQVRISFLSSDLAYQSSITWDWETPDDTYFEISDNIYAGGDIYPSGSPNYLGRSTSPWTGVYASALNVNNIAPLSGDTIKVSPSANNYFELTEKVIVIDEGEEPIELSLSYLTGSYVLGEETGEILALCPTVGIYQHDAEETNCGIVFLSSDLAYQSSITYDWGDTLPYFAFGAGIIPNGAGEENFLGTTSSPWYDFHVGNDSFTRIDISSVTDPVVEITGTYMQISAEQSTQDILILKAPVLYYCNSDYTTYSRDNYNFTDGLLGRSDLSTDNSGNSKLNMHNGIDSSAYRTGTINEYGTGCVEINSGGFYNLTNSATYSGSNNLNIINAGTYHYIVNSATYTPTSGSKVGIINVANFFALQESTAAYDAGAISRLGNTLLYGTLSTSGSAYEADSINAWCIIEGFSTASTHNSSIVDRSTYPIIFGQDNKSIRFGSGYTGTFGQWETYGDAEFYYDGTDFVINPKRIGSGKVAFHGAIRTRGIYERVVIKTTNYTIDTEDTTKNDDIVICDSDSVFTVYLPPAISSGRILKIKNINTGIITIEGQSTETIDGDFNIQLSQWDGVFLVDYNYGCWSIIER